MAREWILAVLGLSALAIAAAVYFHAGRPELHVLRISAGSRKGTRYQIARRLARSAREYGVNLLIVETEGSEQALDLVDSGELDLALVQGGLEMRGRPGVRQVASLKIEPLHLLVKAEIDPGSDGARGLEFLRSRRVNLGPRGSGTHDLAREVLDFAGLAPRNERNPDGYLATTLSYDELTDERLDHAELPDAMFTVSALPSPVVRHLVTKRGYRLVPLRFGHAFELDAQPFDEDVLAPDAFASQHLVQRSHVYDIEIPAYTYGLSPPIPPEPISTFGTRLLLVANHRTSAQGVERLLEAAHANAPGGPVIDRDLLEIDPEIEWHAGTITFREHNKPLLINDAIDLMEKGTSLTGGLLGGVFFLWQWYRHRLRRRRELGFEMYLLKVAELEEEAMNVELRPMLDLKELARIQVRLNRLKTEALERFAAGELEGEELISGFITHVNNARDYVTRLILHERDNIEQRAGEVQRTAESLWTEAIGHSVASTVEPPAQETAST